MADGLSGSAHLARAEREGVRLQFWARTLALLVIGVFFYAINGWSPAQAYSQTFLVVFLLNGVVYYRLVLAGYDPFWLGISTGTLDIAIVTYLIVAPNPFQDMQLPAAMSLREAGFKYLLIFVCLGALNLSPRLAAWLGIAAALSWSLAVFWVLRQPDSLAILGSSQGISHAERMRIYFDPHFVDVIDQSTHVAVMVIIAGIIATVGWRSRRLAEDFTIAERARTNLARHFSPNVVEELAQADEPFGPARRQDIGVLFADIVGFTNYSEDHAPETVFELLREFHRRMEQVVFDHGGTVDNYIGDCIMATFGVPKPADDDAIRAIACAQAMVAAVEGWNAERTSARATPVDVRLGLHYGPVVLGAVGSERSLSFAAVGDTCNVASRLQTLCRERDAAICIGGAVMAAAHGRAPEAVLAGLVHHGPVALRGRDRPVDVWLLPKEQSQNRRQFEETSHA